MFRVQKLLLAEFEEIYEPVLVENPFTLVDAAGVGVRQYQVALTGCKLVFGCDNFYKHELAQSGEPYCYSRGLDPAIECFELVSALPLEFIRFKFYRRGERALMMVSVLQGAAQENPMTFEFGGHIYKQHFWHTWRDRIAALRIMHPRYSLITYSSPFSSTDVQLDEEEVHAVQVHTRRPSSVYSHSYSSSNGYE